jgi:hypothetical protein
MNLPGRIEDKRERHPGAGQNTDNSNDPYHNNGGHCFFAGLGFSI